MVSTHPGTSPVPPEQSRGSHDDTDAISVAGSR